MNENQKVNGSFWIFDTMHGDVCGGDVETASGTAIGPFESTEAAISHATEHTAGWASWQIGEVSVVHTYTPPSDDAEDDSVCPACGAHIDHCIGHGEIGDPNGRQILDMHDEGDHSACHEDADCQDDQGTSMSDLANPEWEPSH